MRHSFKEYIQDSEDLISESLLGKTYAVAQNRSHASNKTKFQSALAHIQSTAKKGLTEDDQEKRIEMIFTMFFDLAAALKIASDMSTNSVNISTAGVLDTESVKKELERAFSKLAKK